MVERVTIQAQKTKRRRCSPDELKNLTFEFKVLSSESYFLNIYVEKVLPFGLSVDHGGFEGPPPL